MITNYFLLSRRFVFAAAVSLIPFTANYASTHDTSTEAIGKRIAPVGQVNIAGEEQNEATQSEPAETQQVSVSDEEIYEQYCAMCHASGLAGAPKFRDSADWQPRIEKGMDVMLSNVVNGYNVMPMKGACMTCDEAQLKAAIEYMLPK